MTFSVRLEGANRIKHMEINDKNTMKKDSYAMIAIVRG
jgi:hypothetical protein